MIINANALHIPLADKRVHTIVTSPPYYGLRDYGTATWQGGDSDCEHNPQRPDGGDRSDRTLPLGRGGVYRDVCGKCGAIRIDAQIGLEVTPDAYIANLVEVFRECKRILRDDGTLWVNIGDSYFSKPKSNYNGKALGLQSKNYGTGDTTLGYKQSAEKYLANKRDGMKDKDLIGVPWMLAFALRADGWYLRQDIIWAKPNPMPESVKDRCTKSHEYIFLLSKSAKYYYDNEAINEPSVRVGDKQTFGGKKARDGEIKEGDPRYRGGSEQWGRDHIQGETRNKRDVWTVTTKPYKGAHYATFNPDLIKPCILAGAPEGGIVFDPFVGSGTMVATAMQLGRKGIGLDLSLKYLNENASVRIEAERLPLLEMAGAQ